MSRNGLYTTIGVLVALVLAFGAYIAWQESQKPKLEIKLDEQGLRIDGNG